jgi:hypothetical protein
MEEAALGHYIITGSKIQPHGSPWKDVKYLIKMGIYSENEIIHD